MNLLTDVKPGDENEFKVVIEIPRGSQNKYEYDHEGGYFALDRVLHSPFHYPTNYGFVPRTLSGDGDPVDACVLSSFDLPMGCVVKCRAVCMLQMEDEAGIDNKVLCVPVKDPRYHGYKSMKDVPEIILKEFEHFFAEYKKNEKGKFVKVKGWVDIEGAKKEVKEGIAHFKH